MHKHWPKRRFLPVTNSSIVTGKNPKKPVNIDLSRVTGKNTPRGGKSHLARDPVYHPSTEPTAAPSFFSRKSLSNLIKTYQIFSFSPEIRPVSFFFHKTGPKKPQKAPNNPKNPHVHGATQCE